VVQIGVGWMRDAPERRKEETMRPETSDTFLKWALFITATIALCVVWSCALSPATSEGLRRAGQSLSGPGGVQCDRDEQCSTGETCRDGVCS
jgi:hypothetical protein